MSLREIIVERIRTRGPLTFAEYMDLALYHPQLGYYARAHRRSGRAGDFFTSVDVGPIFGELLAVQLAEMHDIFRQRPSTAHGPHPDSAVLSSAQRPHSGAHFDLVEAGAADGRLARDVLDALATRATECYRDVRVHLIERGPKARAAHLAGLGPHAGKLVTSSEALPDRIHGVLYANELLDALPVHVVQMTEAGLREIYVAASDGRLVECVAEPSTPELQEYFDRLAIRLSPGWRAEVSLAAAAWVRSAARRLDRGFMLLVDYGHESTELFSPSHAAGTLRTYQSHLESASSGEGPPWLADPGGSDITAHVDLTTVQRVARCEGLDVLGVLDQTYFLIGLGAADLAGAQPGTSVEDVRRRLALKTLLMPNGLGSTHKVLIFGKDVGRPALRGLSYGQRIT